MKNLVVLFAVLMSFTYITLGQDCNEIIRTVDEFTGRITIRTPSRDHTSLTKVILQESDVTVKKALILLKEDSTSISYLRLSATGLTLNVGVKGVIILFKDGSTLNWPNEEIDSDRPLSGSRFWRYSTFIRLSNNELEMLQTKEIDKYRLYIYDTNLSDIAATRFMRMVNCAVNTN